MLKSFIEPSSSRNNAARTPRNDDEANIDLSCMDVSSMNMRDLNDKYACAELIQAWGLYRDQGKWPELLATFNPGSQISVSWFSGDYCEFVEHCRKSFEAGQRSKHQIFPSVVRVADKRAIAETNVVILVR